MLRKHAEARGGGAPPSRVMLCLAAKPSDSEESKYLHLSSRSLPCL